MSVEKFMHEIRDNLDAVITQSTDLGRALYQRFCAEHPADIAAFLEDISRDNAIRLFGALPAEVRINTFPEFSDEMKAVVLAHMSDPERTTVLNALGPDELTDLFDQLSDEDLKTYLELLRSSVREQVVSLLRFDPESAGGVMHTDVLTLVQDFTVERSIKLLQRLQPSRDVHQRIFVTNAAHILVGYINLEDLVLQKPEMRLASFMRQNELVARAEEDREKVAKEMVHYGLMIVPVVDERNHFLGVIPSETLVDVLVEEATEDVQKMAALSPTKLSYFKLPFFKVMKERSYVLAVLLLAESFSRTILHAYESTFQCSVILYSFIPMLMSLGGNTSHQTSAIMIQGIASGEVIPSNVFRFLRREFIMAFCLALVLGLISFARVLMTGASVWHALAISTTASVIVLCAVSLGSVIPLVLKRLNMDPAFSAGPFLATMMDVLGVLIYCAMCTMLLR
jgi:magnesium transporter